MAGLVAVTCTLHELPLHRDPKRQKIIVALLFLLD